MVYSVSCSAKASVVATGQNVKRESKAYSYEEQQWDRELREELQRKKGQKPATRGGKKVQAKGKTSGGRSSSTGAAAVGKDGVHVTKKQQEAIEARMVEEEAIRKRLKQVMFQQHSRDLAVTFCLSVEQ